MNWVYQFDSRALKELRKLGRPAQTLIIEYLDQRVAGKRNPRRLGKALKADLADRIEHGERFPELDQLFKVPA